MIAREILASGKALHVHRIAFLLIASFSVTPLPAQSVVPVALDFSADGRILFVANRDGGSVSLLDSRTQEVVEEFKVLGTPIDLLVQGEQILVLDRQLAMLRVFSLKGVQLAEHALGSPPARMASNANGDQLFIASKFGKELLSFSKTGEKWIQCSSCKLPFPPLEMKWFDNQLLVAGAFEAELALLDCSQIESRIKVLQTSQLGGHNIRGIELIGNEVYLTLQEINPLAHSSRDDVHWGNLLANKLVHFPTEAHFNGAHESPRQLNASRVDVELGQPGSGCGDPGRLLYDDSDERLYILVAGSSEVLEFDPAEQEIISRVDTGTAPRAIANANGHVAIANQFSNDVTWIALKEDETASQKSYVTTLSNSKPTSVQRGEQLFFDSRLSHDGWMSCHSCHSDGHSSGKLNDNQSDGGFGAAKRIPSLFGVAHTEPWGWTGQVTSLQQQVKNSVRLTMHGSDLDADKVEDLVAFMTSLNPFSSTQVSNSGEVANELAKGEKLFQNLGCSNCHQPKHDFTSQKTYDVGWKDRQGNRQFNPPSLLGLRFRPRLFHDARSSLETMLQLGEHKLPRKLSAAEQTSLLAYLRNL